MLSDGVWFARVDSLWESEPLTDEPDMTDLFVMEIWCSSKLAICFAGRKRRGTKKGSGVEVRRFGLVGNPKQESKFARRRSHTVQRVDSTQSIRIHFVIRPTIIATSRLPYRGESRDHVVASQFISPTTCIVSGVTLTSFPICLNEENPNSIQKISQP